MNGSYFGFTSYTVGWPMAPGHYGFRSGGSARRLMLVDLFLSFLLHCDFRFVTKPGASSVQVCCFLPVYSNTSTDKLVRMRWSFSTRADDSGLTVLQCHRGDFTCSSPILSLSFASPWTIFIHIRWYLRKSNFSPLCRREMRVKYLTSCWGLIRKLIEINHKSEIGKSQWLSTD